MWMRERPTRESAKTKYRKSKKRGWGERDANVEHMLEPNADWPRGLTWAERAYVVISG